MTITGVPRVVWPGKRTHVVMWTGPASTRMFYTWSPWAASLCDQAYRQKQPITIEADESEHGWRIAHVALTGQEATP